MVDNITNPKPSAISLVSDVLFSSALGAGFGYVAALMTKTNVVASVIIFGASALVSSAVNAAIIAAGAEKTVKGKVIQAVSDCLIHTVTVIASVAFGLMGTTLAAVSIAFILIGFAYALHQAFKPGPDQAKAQLPKECVA